MLAPALVLVAVLVAVLGGCTTPASDTTPPAATPTATASTAGTTPATPAAPATERLVNITRTGGLAGVNESVLVKADGSYVQLKSGATAGTGRMAPDRLAELRAAVAAAGFPGLERIQPGGKDPGPDGFRYTLVAGGREVVTGGPDVPPALMRVIELAPLP
ncbi:hypothetical protein [Streptomyces sp. NPDC089799]|uniref:hypothetical protein n=1 Tax=Streptomyces sp. NPDC089799 TaxID=3155066 RepID=UPI00342C1C7C